MHRFAPSLLALLIALPAQAGTFTTRQGARVYPLGGSLFEVVPGARNEGEIYWCAAGDYAQRALKVPWTTRVYIVQGRAPSVTNGRKSAVQFTLDPAANGVTPREPSLSLNSLKPGESMSVQQAHGYCMIRPPRF